MRAQIGRELAISEGITIRQACEDLGRHAGKASVAKRKQKQLSIQSTLPVLFEKNTDSHGCFG